MDLLGQVRLVQLSSPVLLAAIPRHRGYCFARRAATAIAPEEPPAAVGGGGVAFAYQR